MIMNAIPPTPKTRWVSISRTVSRRVIQECLPPMLGLGFLISSSSVSSGAILFAEDFESYPIGSSVNGQGGWMGDDIRIGFSSTFGSRVLDGFQQTGTTGWASVTHLLARGLDAGEITTFSLQARSVPLPFGSSGKFWLQGGSKSVGWFTATFEVPEWIFLAPDSGERLYFGALKTEGTFGVVVNGPAQTVYGFFTYKSGENVRTSDHFIDAQFLRSIDRIQLSMPPGYGFQIDNIKVQSIPEPSAWFLSAPAAAWLVLRSLSSTMKRSRIHISR